MISWFRPWSAYSNCTGVVHGCRRRKSPCSGPLGERQGYKIESTDKAIDKFVYVSHKGIIYELTEEEIKIVEGK
jgi:hypothetical protein